MLRNFNFFHITVFFTVFLFLLKCLLFLFNVYSIFAYLLISVFKTALKILKTKKFLLPALSFLLFRLRFPPFALQTLLPVAGAPGLLIHPHE